MPATPETTYGPELRPRRTVPVLGLAVAALSALAVVAIALTDALSGAARLGTAAAVGLVLVLAPGLGALALLRRHVHLGTDCVHVTSGRERELVMTLRWSDLEQVRPSWSSPWSSWRWFGQPQVLLVGRPSAGRRAGAASRLLVGDRFYEGFGDLLAALEPEVRRRPDVVPTGHHRELFEEFLFLYVQHAPPTARD